MTVAVEPQRTSTGTRQFARPTTLALLHPKGGVGRSTTAYMLGAELALRGRRVVLEDLDQGQHLSRVFERHPLGLDLLKGPEEGSVQALPALLRWLQEAGGARLLGFLPTMHKPRRAEARYWLGQLQRLAEQHHTRVLEPIGDLASVAAWRLDGHPYASLAEDVVYAIGA